MLRKHHAHLTYEERCQIFDFLARKISVSQIAALLNKHRSSIYRELKRGTKPEDKKADYSVRYASSRTQKLRFARKKPYKFTSDIKDYIHEKLQEHWSPAQISGRLRLDKPEVSISHETIYQYIWRDKKAGGNLYKYLRKQGKKYKKRGGLYQDRGILGRRDIDERPDSVNKKERLGDWEGDLVLGSRASKKALVTMVDRASKLTKIGLVSDKEAFKVRNEIVKMMADVKDKVHTITLDNGREFVHHQAIAGELGAEVYFAKPYHSWERGLNEHTNGLIRQYFPKGTSLGDVTHDQIKKAENRLNNRPRKILNYRTPNEVFFLNFPTHHSVAFEG